MLKGAIHVHSTYSDGEFTLPELREAFLAAGCGFVCLTDHAQYFDELRLEAYRRECESLSDQRFVLIPGLEYECRERMHILGYGVTALAGSDDPQEVIRHIERQGGISVIAHPKESSFAWIESFEFLPSGIEAWNSKYDGRYAPRPAVFRVLWRLQRRRPEVRAFYGQDLHWKRQFRGLLNVLPAMPPERERILAAFQRGDYRASKGDLELPSNAQLPDSLMLRFARAQRRSDLLRSIVKNAKNTADRWGLAVPASIKSRLRRLF